MIKRDILLLIVCVLLMIIMGNVALLMIEYFTVGYGLHPAFGSGLLMVILSGIYIAVKMIQKEYNNEN